MRAEGNGNILEKPQPPNMIGAYLLNIKSAAALAAALVLYAVFTLYYD